MPTNEIAFLKNRRGGFKGRITAVQNELAQQPEISLARAQSMLESIKSAYEKFDLVQADLEHEDEGELGSLYRAEVDALFDNVRYQLVDIIEQKRAQQNQHTSQNRPKLPDLTVPKFDGEMLNWLNFKSVFEEIVVKQMNLDNVSKYQYLETSLTGGSAYELIKSVTGSDFVTAWSKLECEYNHLGLIREKHTKDLYDVECTDGTSKGLQRFLDKIESNLHSLRALEVDVSNWDLLLIHHLSTKLDVRSRKELESKKKADENITYEQFKGFLKSRIRILSAMEQVNDFQPTSTSTPKPQSRRPEFNRNPKSKVFVARESVPCLLCSESHLLFQCKSFLSMDTGKRQEFVRDKRICFNCLSSNHWAQQCSSTNTCKHCGKHHNTLLCRQITTGNVSTPVLVTSETSEPNSPENITASAVVSSVLSKRIILATAIISLENPLTGQSVVCRAFLDGGATTHFVTESFVQMLSLTKVTSFTEISGINDIVSVNKYKVTALIKSRVSDFTEEVELLVSRKIVGDLPTEPVDISGLNIESIKELADPDFQSPAKVDVLLGASIFFKIISGNKREICPGLYMLPSLFGNLIVGQKENKTKAIAFCSIQLLREQIKKFWDIEQTVFSNSYTVSEKLAERHYVSSFVRCPEGKYSVGLPFNENVNKLGKSRELTKLYFLRQENNLMKNEDKYNHYREFIAEMIAMNHLEEDLNVGKADNFITHHIISRPSSTTTKHRVVFNASMKTSTGISLNDCLLSGPTIQQPIFTHLIHWRQHNIAIIGDIAKMYRQIWHHSEDRNFLKIWWRFSRNEELKSYRIKTITYGTASAPFSAIRTIKQLAIDEEENFPIESQLLRNNFYVDDFSCSFPSLSEAITRKTNITKLLKSGGFELRKFSSNSAELVPDSTEGNVVKVLGVAWDVQADQILLEFGNILSHSELTKSSVLSQIAQMFDPLGLFAPVVLQAKIVMQKVWLESNIQWDDVVPDDIKTEWNEFQRQLKDMIVIKVPRALIRSHDDKIEVHGFADASEKGFGACIYVKTNSGCRLVCAKSRVAPLKKLTIPRLELQAALLLARLMKTTKDAFSEDYPTFLWSDSEITLYRIRSIPAKYCTFVGTRISEIQELSSPSQWFHIPSKLNPADLCSRGLMPIDIQSCQLWWEGPSFLTNQEESWPNQAKFVIDESLLELIPQPNHHAVTKEDTFIVRFSNFKKLLRVTSYIMRFFHSITKIPSDRTYISQPISANECQDALNRLIRYSQNLTFKDDIKQLQHNKQVSKSSRLCRLNPFIDSDGILRVGGRLTNAKISFDNQHQIILSPEVHLSHLILQQFHQDNLHCGPLTLLNTSRQRYWILNGRNASRKIVHSCIICFKNKPVLINQIMGQLPANRLTPSRPFQIVGLDFCGYFLVKNSPKSKVTLKTYICLLTCFVTRATHLEVVYDLTTEAFLAALRRFVSRRGIPLHIHSDNATNFVGASRQLIELKELQMSQLHQKEVLQFCCDNAIQWHFIPPRSPHFGALWESSVKQAKYHLKRSVREMIFTMEQLSTIVCQIEAVLNSRPLTPLSDDPDDFKALTPGHFLIGQELNAIPEPSMLELNVNRLSIWQKIQFVTQEFWKKWRLDYINSLQSRQKWTSLQPNVEVGRLVLLSEDNVPVSQWPLGRIVEVHPGKDGVVRVITVRTAKNILKRSIVRIALLPIEQQEQSD